MFGSHLSIAGGLHNALIEARALKMDCVQVFTKNQRQWSAPPLKREDIALWRHHRQATRIKVVVSHDSYLINLASPAPGNWQRSVALFRDELERCEALEIPLLVMHPGAHMGAGEPAGLARVARALNQLHQDLPGYRTITCLEVTAGQGTSLGRRFEEIRQIIDQVHQPQRLAVCLDTAHLLEAGYDLTSAAGMQATLEELDDVLGLKLVRAIHINDSKTPRGSRVDRHEHIGKGHVARAAFQVLVRHRQFQQVPKILETPKEDAPSGQPWDVVNLRSLRRLLQPQARKSCNGPKKH